MSLLFQARRQLLSAAAERYRARVMADGGTVFSMAAVRAAYAMAAAWGLPEQATHWSSPQFGTKAVGNVVAVRYCLFGHDAAPTGTAGSWLLQPAAPGKAQQHYTNKFALQFAGLAWNSLDLVAHTICQPANWQSDAYPYFPLIECSGQPATYGGFLLAAEAGSIEGGYQDANGTTLAVVNSLPPVNTLTTIGLRVDKSLPLPAHRRLFVNGAQGLSQYDSGQPTLTAYAQANIYLGARGDAQNYAFDGNINDVFVTNKVLPAAAIAYLNNQKNAY